MCNTDPVGPGEFWFLDLEIEESGQGDGIEKPGSETDDSNKDKCQTNGLYVFSKEIINKSRPSLHLKKLTILWKSPGISTTREMTVVKISAGDGVSLWT